MSPVSPGLSPGDANQQSWEHAGCAHPDSLHTHFQHACEVDVSATANISEMHVKAQRGKLPASRLQSWEPGVLAPEPRQAVLPLYWPLAFG